MKKILTLITMMLALLFLAACQSQSKGITLPVVKDPLTRTESLLHTVVQLSIYHENQEETMDGAIALIKELEMLLAPTGEDSDVYKINQAAGKEAVKVDPRTFELIKAAQERAKSSDGRFDISIGIVNQLWKIGSEDARVPAPSEIETALPFVDYKKIQLDEKNQTVYVETGMALELGAISKGYIADQVKAFLASKGVTTAIINLGGNVVVMGTSPNNENGWKVGVQGPDETRGATVGSVYQTNRSIVTSGIYERFLEVDGKIYHHILNPQTGYPVENDISGVTVFTDTSTEGDGLSTALFTYGIEEGLKYVNSQDGIEAVFIDKEHGVHLSDGLKDSFELSNKEYHLAD
ncbi:FAD:protein FMN transferase [Streptococcus sp. X16XC17]|uniref:FAD:protein FMN transferase n=1 Tax=unclassified Streptococcus TaxID=2608887 RepID=UPI00066FF95D|nr:MULTISPECIES: FAD:protein FMN transferase [unclassified Streptococcus]TCD46239.1 FAD:protein FMN transferase [Streptococcus sp. X16XC17]